MKNSLGDKFAHHLDFEVLEVKKNFSIVQGVIKDEYLNGEGIGHGGYIYTLADFAFAIASNNQDRIALSSAASINYLRPCHAGIKIFAIATLVTETEKHGVFDVVIKDQNDCVFAVFHARASYKNRG